ncbi:hypothetical protein G5V59_02545 [Nocardioides sp. W3-2-3]|uniref:hypothetical protein n=1 Tax=Nocardioides convexus TaxID=2712224 RepID=UPI00241869E1|nr:hypothetical protein [Nocardioides convexus]NGZ99632.1 hypothetical protein [Nocardioides convexus]
MKSVDWVTRPGRGGKVLQVLESARDVTEARSIGQWVESRIHRDFTVLADDMAGDGRLTREERISLSAAIGDGLAAFVAKVEADAPQALRPGPVAGPRRQHHQREPPATSSSPGVPSPTASTRPRSTTPATA